MTLHLDLLGLPKVTLEGRTLELPPKSLALLAYLLVNGRSKRDVIAKILWHNVSANPRNNLSQERASLIKHLGLDVLEGNTELLEVKDVVTCDVLPFLELGTSDPQTAWALYRGDFLKNLEFHPRLLGARAFGEEYEGWLSQQRSKFDTIWRQLSLGLANLEITRGAFERAIPLLEATQDSEHSILEDAARMLMLCHAIVGASDQVTRVFAHVSKQLLEELGVTPMRATREVFELSRDAPQHALERLRAMLPATASPPPRLLRSEEDAVKFVGRETDLTKMLEFLEASRAAFKLQTTVNREVRVILVLGEPGVGKTRLLEECFALQDQALWWQVSAQAIPDQIPLLMFQKAARTRIATTPEVLNRLNPITRAALARLLPEFIESDGSTLAPDLEQRALFSALRAIFSSDTEPTLLVLEDLHWADENSVAFIEYLFGDAPEQGLVMLATARDSEGSRTNLERLKSLIRTRSTGWIHDLTGLSVNAVLELANTFQRADINTELLHQRTGGNPLFVIELLQGESAGRQRITDLILDRVRACGELASQTLEAFAVLGDGKTVGILREVSGRSLEETVQAVQVLQDAKLISDQGDVLQFRHDLIREFTYESLPNSRRALLELRAARALRMQPVLAAPHYQACRAIWDQETTLQAARSFLEAGRQFATLGDSRAGLGWLDLAWQADETISWRTDVTLVRARVLERYGLFREASQALERAELFLNDASNVQRAAWWNLQAQIELSAYGNHEAAKEKALKALAESESSSQPELLLERCRSLRFLGSACRANWDLEEAVVHLRKALMIAESLGAREEEVATLSMLGLSLVDLKQAEALPILQRALSHLQEFKNPLEINALNNLGVYFERVEGNFHQAAQYFSHTYEKSREWDVKDKYSYLNNLATTYFYDKQFMKARQTYESAMGDYELAHAQNDINLVLILVNLAEVEMRMGLKTVCLNHLEKARTILETKQNKRLSANLNFYEAELLSLHGEIESAKQAYEHCLVFAKETKYLQRQACALARLALLEQSPALGTQALEVMNTPLTQATFLLIQGNTSDAFALVKDDAFEQGFLHLGLYFWTSQKKHLIEARALLGDALRVY
jgi:AAA ATPase domain/Bacterial transcriptional activator domain